MKIKVFSRKTIEEFKTDQKHIVISVRDPESSLVKLPENKHRLARLEFSFHDLDHMPDNSKGIVLGAQKPYQLFAPDQAERILEFVETFKDEIELIAVNCEAGISRSSGIAAALSRILNGCGTDQYYFDRYIPNMLVYRTMLEADYENKENNN